MSMSAARTLWARDQMGPDVALGGVVRGRFDMPADKSNSHASASSQGTSRRAFPRASFHSALAE